MTRLAPVPPNDRTDEQRALVAKVLAQRGGTEIRGPFGVLMHAADVGERVADFVDHFLSDTRVPHNVKELAILAIARRYKAQYEWFVHHRRAMTVGVDPAVADAVREGRVPEFGDQKERLAFEMVEDIVEHRRLSDPLYARAVETFGEAAVVELVALIGFYIAIAVVLISFQVEVPEGGPIDFPD